MARTSMARLLVILVSIVAVDWLNSSNIDFEPSDRTYQFIWRLLGDSCQEVVWSFLCNTSLWRRWRRRVQYELVQERIVVVVAVSLVATDIVIVLRFKVAEFFVISCSCCCCWSYWFYLKDFISCLTGGAMHTLELQLLWAIIVSCNLCLW